MGQNTRDVFFNLVCDKVHEGQDIVIVSADLAAIALDRLRLEFPQRFINVGIAEQNLIAVSAGLANTGKKVIAYGNSPFIWSRAYDQLRVIMGCMNVPLTLLSIGVGMNFCNLGQSHFNVEDITLLRGLPNLEINAVNTASMAEKALVHSLSLQHPNVLRMEHTNNDYLYEGKDIDYAKGYILHKPGTDCLLVATASIVSECYAVAERLADKGIDAGLLEIISFPADEEGISQCLKAADKIITVEEHVLQGGVGSYICELLADSGISKPIKRIGLDFKKGYYSNYGTVQEVRRLLGLNADGIERVVREWLEQNKQ